MKLEKWLYLKGYTKKGTGCHKIKANKGDNLEETLDAKVNELAIAMLDKGDFLHFQNLINEIKEMDKK